MQVILPERYHFFISFINFPIFSRGNIFYFISDIFGRFLQNTKQTKHLPFYFTKREN